MSNAVEKIERKLELFQLAANDKYEFYPNRNEYLGLLASYRELLKAVGFYSGCYPENKNWAVQYCERANIALEAAARHLGD